MILATLRRIVIIMLSTRKVHAFYHFLWIMRRNSVFFLSGVESSFPFSLFAHENFHRDPFHLTNNKPNLIYTYICIIYIPESAIVI